MKIIQVENAWGIDNINILDAEKPTPGPGEVLLHIKAVSLNYRDLLTVKGMGGAYPLPLIPCSDSAAEVVGLGDGVTTFKEGDRVCPLFFPNWADGPGTVEEVSWALGGTAPGVMQEYMVLPEHAVTPAPKHFSDAEASTLSCAALTAWRAVAVEGKAGPGSTVLVEGTGGVSIFALQFAKMLGATVIATSSSDDKLARAKDLGADHVINYKDTPEWGAKAAELTGGKGVDVVVEVGGADTLGQAMGAAAFGGAIVIIGVLSGFQQQLFVPAIFAKQLRLTGITVGNKAQFQDMVAAIEKAEMHPVVDATFSFGKVKEAFSHMESGSHFGKIVIEN